MYADNDIINEDDSYIYFNSRLDFYITPNIGINAMYFNGQEE